MNSAPTGITFSNTTYDPPTPTTNFFASSLTATDINTLDTFSFSVAGGSSGSLFSVVGTSLEFRYAGQTGNGLEVSVRVTDGGGLSYTRTVTFNES